MKSKFIFFLGLFLGMGSLLQAQVFNTSSALKPGNVSLGVEPSVYINGATDFNLFLHGRVGLTHNVDFGMKLGVMGNEVYLGGDVKFALSKMFSVSAGAHSWGDFGLDGTALLTFPLTIGVKLYTGLDADVVFANNTEIPLWIPLGLKIGIHRNIAFIFESEIRVTQVGSHFLGGGLNFYF